MHKFIHKCFLIAVATALFTSQSVSAQTTLPDGKLGFGIEGLSIPAGPVVNTTPARTVDLLETALAGAVDAPAKVKLLRDLGITRLAAALVPLRKYAADTDPVVRAEVARAIGAVGDSSGAEILKSMLTDNDANVRREVILAGAQLSDPSFVLVGLSDKEALVISASISAASTPAHADALAIRLPNFSPQQQVEAIRAVGRLGSDKPHADSIVGFLEGNVAQRAAAVEGLGKLGAKRFADRAAKLLSDTHPTVRRAAVSALITLADVAPRRSQALEALNDPDATVRTAAATVLATVPDASVVQPLVARLTVKHAPLHDAARLALLAAAKDPRSEAAALTAAVSLLSDVVPERRADGSWLLGQTRSLAGFDQHIRMVDDPSALVGAQVAQSLGQIGNPAASANLFEMVERIQNSIPKGEGAAQVDSNLATAQANAIVATALLGRADILPVVKGLIGSKTAPPLPRAATIWANGYLDNQAVAKRLIAIINDIEESSDAKNESIKALGNLRSQAAADLLKPGAIPDILKGDPVGFYLAHWAADRIHNASTPFVPENIPYRATTSVQTVEP